MFTAFVAYQPGVVGGWPAPLAVVIALLFAAAFGWIMERFTLRPLRERPVLTRVIVTLGWLLVLQSAAGLIWRDTSYHIPLQIFPQSGVRIAQLTLGYNQLASIIVAGGLAVGLGIFLKKSPLGVAMRATSDSPSAARLLGIDVNRVSAMAWIIGSLLAGITGLLLAPLTTLNTTDLTIIVIEALGAALIGGLTSLGWTFTGGILLGVAQSLLSLHALNLPDGAKDVLTLAVILAVLLLRREVRTLAISTAGGVGMSITVRTQTPAASPRNSSHGTKVAQLTRGALDNGVALAVLGNNVTRAGLVNALDSGAYDVGGMAPELNYQRAGSSHAASNCASYISYTSNRRWQVVVPPPYYVCY